MSKYGIQTKGTGAVMGRSSYAVGGPAADPRRKLGPRKPKTGRPSIPEFPRKPSPGPKGGPRKPSPGSKKKTITGKKQRKNKAIKDLKNKTKARYAARQETARDTINPMKAERVFEKFRSPRNAKTFYANKPGSKYEGMASKAMNKRLDLIDKKPEMFKEIKNLKGGGKADGGRMNTSRMNRLEELGRVDSEKAYTSKGKRNLKDEKKRIVKEVAGK